MSAYFKGLIPQLSSPLQYHFCMGDEKINLNECIGKEITLRWNGRIECSGCGAIIKKTYQNGFCFMCVRSKAMCDLCIVKPERCHYHEGTCREPDWGLRYCFQEHVVYLANSTSVKVGISRASNIPKRWMDQGATQGVVLLRCQNRLASGLIEVELAKHLTDKSNWRKLMTENAEPVDLEPLHAKWQAYLKERMHEIVDGGIIWEDFHLHTFSYPIDAYPDKAKSIKLKPNEPFSSVLLGIKGQYLLFAEGGINLKTHMGYELELGC